MSEKKQYYRALGLPDGTPTNLVTKAYKKLALETHPGKHPDQAHRFAEISEAYLKLLPRDKRKKMPKDHNEMYAHHFSSLFPDSKNPNSRFNLFFGGAIPMNGKTKQKPSSSGVVESTKTATKSKAELEEERRKKLEMELIAEEEAAKRAELEAEQKKKEAAKAAEEKRKKAELQKKRREKEQEEQKQKLEEKREKERRQQLELEARLKKEDEERVRQADFRKQSQVKKTSSESSRRIKKASHAEPEGDDEGWAVVGKSKSNAPESDDEDAMEDTVDEPSNLPDLVRQLGDMGFGLKKANLALKTKKYNLEQAINALLADEIPDVPDSPEPQPKPSSSKKKRKGKKGEHSPASSPKGQQHSPHPQTEKINVSQNVGSTDEAEGEQSPLAMPQLQPPASPIAAQVGKPGPSATPNGPAPLLNHQLMQQALVHQIQLQRMQKLQQLQQQQLQQQQQMQQQNIQQPQQPQAPTQQSAQQPAQATLAQIPSQLAQPSATTNISAALPSVQSNLGALAQAGQSNLQPNGQPTHLQPLSQTHPSTSTQPQPAANPPLQNPPSDPSQGTNLSRHNSMPQPPGLESPLVTSIDAPQTKLPWESTDISSSAASAPDTPLWTQTRNSAPSDWSSTTDSENTNAKPLASSKDEADTPWGSQDLLAQTQSWLHDLKIDDDEEIGKSDKGHPTGWEDSNSNEMPSLLKPWDVSGMEQKNDSEGTSTFAEPGWLSDLAGQSAWGGLLGDTPGVAKMPWGSDEAKSKRAPPGFNQGASEDGAGEAKRFVTISDLGPQTSELDLRRMAKQFGQVVNTYPIGNTITIEFASGAEAAKAAEKLANETIDGKKINPALKSAKEIQRPTNAFQLFGPLGLELDPGAESFSPFGQFW